MRLKAMKEAGWKKVPVEVVDWPEEKQREFVIKDNLSNAGDWDEDALSFDWDVQQLNDWGLDLPDAGDEKQESEVKELKPYNKVHILISLSPDDFHLIQYYLDSIRETGVVEYEQSAN